MVLLPEVDFGVAIYVGGGSIYECYKMLRLRKVVLVFIAQAYIP